VRGPFTSVAIPTANGSKFAEIWKRTATPQSIYHTEVYE
jgi:hypothetical protein